MEEFSRSRLQSLIKQGQVRLKQRTIVEPGRRVKCGDEYELTVPEAEDATPQAENIPLDVVFEDEHLIVINKPAGLVVHPAAGNWSGTLVNALLHHCGDSLSGIGGVRRPGIVHRLDKDTGGLMVAAKSDRAHRGLTKQFADHGRNGPLERAYLALVWGALARPKGSIEAALGRSSSNRLKMAVVREDRGKHAITHYERLKRYLDEDGVARASLVRCTLETGRTHQIRVHMAHLGHPLLGDEAYGAGYKASSRNLSEQARQALQNLHRQALHAATLGFEHPVSGEHLHFESPLPADLQFLLDALEAK